MPERFCELLDPWVDPFVLPFAMTPLDASSKDTTATTIRRRARAYIGAILLRFGSEGWGDVSIAAGREGVNRKCTVCAVNVAEEGGDLNEGQVAAAFHLVDK